jgi:hypothetical protein
VARKIEHAGQRHLGVKLLHAACEKTKAGVVAAFVLPASLMPAPNAPQSEATARWHKLGVHIARQILAERVLKDTPETPLLPAPA